MAYPTVINGLGNLTGWSKVVIRLFGRTLVGVKSVKYSDNKEIENEHGVGEYAVGTSEGNYTADASVELLQEEVFMLGDALGPGQRLQDVPEFDIEVSYNWQGRIVTDRIRNCRFMDRGVDTKQGDKVISQEYKLKTSHIEWNV